MGLTGRSWFHNGAVVVVVVSFPFNPSFNYVQLAVLDNNDMAEICDDTNFSSFGKTTKYTQNAVCYCQRCFKRVSFCFHKFCSRLICTYVRACLLILCPQPRLFRFLLVIVGTLTVNEVHNVRGVIRSE